MRVHYYAAYGSNGVIVLANYGEATKVRNKYMRNPRNIKGFVAADDALAFAREYLYSIAGQYRVIPGRLDLYTFYAVRKLPFIEE